MVRCNVCGWEAPPGMNARDALFEHDKQACKANHDDGVTIEYCEVCESETKHVRGRCLERH